MKLNEKIAWIILIIGILGLACIEESHRDCDPCEKPPVLTCLSIDVPSLDLPSIVEGVNIRGRLWLNDEYALVFKAECGLAEGNTVECMTTRADLCTKEE